MKIRSLTISGVRPHYRTPQTLDVDALPGPLVCIVGENGVGKSTLVNCLPGALYRTLPRGDALADLAMAADTFVRADLEVAAGRFVITQSINGVAKKKKGEASVRRDGVDVLDRAQVSEYDTWSDRNLPPPGLLYASTFGAAKSVGLLDPGLTEGQRRAILFRALGLDRIEPLPQACRDLASEARGRGEVIDGQIAVERPRADEAGAAAALGAARTEAAMRADDVREARAHLDRATARHAALLEAFRNAEAATNRRADALREVEHRRQIARGIGLRLMAADAVLVDADAVRAARADELRLAAELRTAEAAYADAKAAAQETRRAQETALAEKAAAEQRFTLADEPRKRVAEIEARETATARELADADAVAAAGARVAAIDAEIPTAEEALQTARVAAEQCRADATAADRDLSEADRRLREAESALFKARAACGDVESARTAGARAEVLRADVASAEDARAKAQAALDEMNEALHDVAGKRILILSSGLISIAAGAESDPASYADEVLARDAETTREAAEAPAKLAAARQAIPCAVQALADAQRELRAAESLAARLPDLERAEVLRDEAFAAEKAALEAKRNATAAATTARTARDAAVAAQERALAVVVKLRDERRVVAATADRAAAIAAARARADELASQRVEASRALVAAEQQVEDARLDASVAFAEATTHAERLDVQRDELTKLLATVTTTTEALDLARRTAAREPGIAAAEATARELRAQQETAQAAVETAQAALDALPEPPASEPVPDVAAQERAVQDAEAALRRAEGAVAVAERALQDAQAAAGRVADLESQRRAIDEEIADWKTIEQTYVAMLQFSIDAAGPELAELTNSLLRSPGCPSMHRYSVTVETQRPRGDGKGMIEDCYVQVVDTSNGFSGASSKLSDGQLAIVGEAVRFAIARIACRTAGIVTPTLVRDETAGMLNPIVVPEYVAMLRAGCAMLGAEKCLIVAHDPAVAALADSVVRIRDGRIERVA